MESAAENSGGLSGLPSFKEMPVLRRDLGFTSEAPALDDLDHDGGVCRGRRGRLRGGGRVDGGCRVERRRRRVTVVEQ